MQSDGSVRLQKGVFGSSVAKKKRKKPSSLHFCINDGFMLERPTRLELATSTLARWRSTKMSYGRISGAFIPCTLPSDPCEFRGPRKSLQSKICGEKEKIWYSSQKSCLQDFPMNDRIFRRGASDRNRTNDTGIFSPLLYRLSYRGITGAFVPAPSQSSRNWGPRKCLRSKDLWGRGGISAFAAAVLRAGLPGKPLTFRRSDPDRARTDDPQRDRLVL